MKDEIIGLFAIASTIFLLLSCNNSEIFAIQNCYGEKIDIEIEFDLDSKDYTILPEIESQLQGNTIFLEIKYPNKVDLIKTNFKVIEKGMPIKKMIIKRLGKEEIINFGQNIMDKMELDIISEISCCPYSLCI